MAGLAFMFQIHYFFVGGFVCEYVMSMKVFITNAEVSRIENDDSETFTET